MNPERDERPPLTDNQNEAATVLIEVCGLDEVADVSLEWDGQKGSVFWGLGRCAHHLADMTPSEVKEMVMSKLEQQGQIEPGS
ncbi:MAG: hypothetical protein U5K77_02435 [Candidatus Saccharibacteria bacterium]|nr:hypothetical protein [Candidatus Saccharibacteria bacterium]